MTDEDRPRGVKSESMESQDDSETPKCTEESSDEVPGQSDAKRARRVTREQKENAMLPNLKPAPGTNL